MSSQETRLNIVCVLVSMLLLALPEVSKSNAVRKLCPSNGFLPHAMTVLFSRFSKGHAYFSSATLSESTCLGQAKVERSIIGNKHGYWYGMTRACYVLNIFLQLRERLMAGVEFINRTKCVWSLCLSALQLTTLLPLMMLWFLTDVSKFCICCSVTPRHGPNAHGLHETAKTAMPRTTVIPHQDRGQAWEQTDLQLRPGSHPRLLFRPSHSSGTVCSRGSSVPPELGPQAPKAALAPRCQPPVGSAHFQCIEDGLLLPASFAGSCSGSWASSAGQHSLWLRSTLEESS